MALFCVHYILFIFQDYHLYTESAYLTKGRWPEGDYEVVVNVSHQEEMKLNKQINTKINGVKLTVVGYYDNVYDNDLYLVNYNTLRANLIPSASKFSICTSNKTETLKYIRDNYKVNVYDNYQNFLLYILDNILFDTIHSLHF